MKYFTLRVWDAVADWTPRIREWELTLHTGPHRRAVLALRQPSIPGLRLHT
jgi:hypothetical protein